MSLLTIYDVACPYCGADAGKFCVSTPGKHVRYTPHVARRRRLFIERRHFDTGGSA